jgi:protein TonB
MSANDTTLPGLPPDPGSDPKAVVSSGWLAGESIFDRRDERKLGRAMGASMLVHGGLFAAIVAIMTVAPAQLLIDTTPLEYKVAFLPEPGPGGGGGGSPAPAPPKPIEIPKHTAPTAVPIPVEKPPEPTEVPKLVAPIETTSSTLLQSSGNAAFSLAAYGGGGSGGGVGSGSGNGVGPGTGGGFGGGAYRPGSGVTSPFPVNQVKPNYTSDAMRAKIQGSVELEVVVLEDGTVGQVRVTKSLDRTFGLDQAAMDAAKKWLFRPGTRQGVPVATIVTLILDFRLH